MTGALHWVTWVSGLGIHVKNRGAGFSAGVLVYKLFIWVGAAIYVAGGAPLGRVDQNRRLHITRVMCNLNSTA